VNGVYLLLFVSLKFVSVLCAHCVEAFSDAAEESQLGVRERLIEARGRFRQLAGFKDRSTIQTFHIFRVGILGDKLRAGMAA
jgi:hypothetical protein